MYIHIVMDRLEIIKGIGEIYNKRSGYKVDLTKRKPILEYKRIPTGIYTIDKHYGGGLPEGQITMLTGLKESSKSSTACKIIGQIQKKYPDKICIYYDMEGHLDQRQAQEHGVDLDPEKLLVLQPKDGSAMADTTMDILDKYPGLIGGIVLDSVTSCTDHRLEEKSAQDVVIGSYANGMNRFLQVLEQKFREFSEKEVDRPTVILINHLRANMKKANLYADDYIIAGGEKPKDVSYAILWFNQIKGEESETADGTTKEAKTKKFSIRNEKNKLGLAVPKMLEYSMVVTHDHEYLKRGEPDELSVILNDAKAYGVLKGYQLDSIGVDQRFSTKKELDKFLQENPDVVNLIKIANIALYRKSKGLNITNDSEPDFLLGHIGKEIIDEITKKAEEAE